MLSFLKQNKHRHVMFRISPADDRKIVMRWVMEAQPHLLWPQKVSQMSYGVAIAKSSKAACWSSFWNIHTVRRFVRWECHLSSTRKKIHSCRPLAWINMVRSLIIAKIGSTTISLAFSNSLASNSLNQAVELSFSIRWTCSPPYRLGVHLYVS